MGVGPDEFRDALRKLAAGLTVVTVEADRGFHGMTASAFAAVSLEPPLVLVCLEKTSRTRALVRRRGRFAANVLAAGQEDVARAFSRPGPKPFDLLEHHVGVVGAPLLHGALCWIECRVRTIVDGGDHDVVIAEVVACRAHDGRPLVYYDRAYTSLDAQNVTRSPGRTSATEPQGSSTA